MISSSLLRFFMSILLSSITAFIIFILNNYFVTGSQVLLHAFKCMIHQLAFMATKHAIVIQLLWYTACQFPSGFGALHLAYFCQAQPVDKINYRILYPIFTAI